MLLRSFERAPVPPEQNQNGAPCVLSWPQMTSPAVDFMCVTWARERCARACRLSAGRRLLTEDVVDEGAVEGGLSVAPHGAARRARGADLVQLGAADAGPARPRIRSCSAGQACPKRRPRR